MTFKLIDAAEMLRGVKKKSIPITLQSPNLEWRKRNVQNELLFDQPEPFGGSDIPKSKYRLTRLLPLPRHLLPQFSLLEPLVGRLKLVSFRL